MYSELVSTYNALMSDVASIRVTMTLYFQLFCNDDETTDLLNRAAGAAFARIKPCIARDLLLSVARLCDPAQTRVKKEMRENCTFPRIIKLVELDGRTDLALRLNRRFEQVVKKRCEPLLVSRNRRLAHNDHITKMHEVDGRDIMPGLSIREVNKIVRSMRKLLAHVASSYHMLIPDDFRGPRFGNEMHIHGRDFRHLIRCLSEGKVPEPISIEDLF